MTEAPAPDLLQSQGGSDSLVTVIIAFAANLVIAIAKTVAAMLTGSASLVAEAAHSWADTGNEIFLLVAERRSDKGRDDSHPLGYGRESYVWSMFAAFGLFTAGAVISIWHGVTELMDPEPAADYLVGYIVLAIAFALEGISFLRAHRQAARSAKEVERPTLDFVLHTSNPTLRAVFAEDAAALIGLLIAGAGLGLHQLSGNPVPDALGSIAVGVLLGVVAVVLIDRNRRFLVGQAVPPDLRQRVLNLLLARKDIDRISYLHLEFVGPGKLYLVAAVDMVGDMVESDLATRLRSVEWDLEQHDEIEEAVLTLATNEEESLPFKTQR